MGHARGTDRQGVGSGSGRRRGEHAERGLARDLDVEHLRRAARGFQQADAVHLGADGNLRLRGGVHVRDLRVRAIVRVHVALRQSAVGGIGDARAAGGHVAQKQAAVVRRRQADVSVGADGDVNARLVQTGGQISNKERASAIGQPQMFGFP